MIFAGANRLAARLTGCAACFVIGSQPYVAMPSVASSGTIPEWLSIQQAKAKSASLTSSSINDRDSVGRVVRQLVVETARFDDSADRVKTKLEEKWRRIHLGDEKAFYGTHGAEAPILPTAPFSNRIATGLEEAADVAALKVVPGLTYKQVELSRAICRAQSARTFVRGATIDPLSLAIVGSKEDTSSGELAAALVEKSIERGDRLRFSLESYCGWKTYGELIPPQSRTTFRMELGKDALKLFLAPETVAEAQAFQPVIVTEAAEPKSLAFQVALAKMEYLLSSFVKENYLGRWSYDTQGFPDGIDFELFAEGKDVTWALLLDGDPAMQAAILLQEQGVRFYPQYVGSTLAALLKNALPEGTKVSWEEYYMDPRRSADPDLYEPRQVLMEWHVEL